MLSINLALSELPSWIILITVGAVGFGYWAIVSIRNKRELFEQGIENRFPNDSIRFIDKNAILRAQESRGYSQVEGMGYLILTKDELYFEMMLFSNTIAIRLDRISGLSETRRIKGKSSIKPMLRIDYTDSSGKDDAIGISVKDLSGWKKKLKTQMDELN